MARVLIPLAQGCEELEAVTIIDLLRRANIDVVTAGLHKGPVTCSRQTVLLPDTELNSVVDEDFDMIVLPGGLPGADHLRDDPRIIQLLQAMNSAGKFTAAICAAPKVLAEAGLLNSKRATAYTGALSDYPSQAIEVTGSPVEIDESIITSRGPGTAMDFALALIEQLLGKDARNQVEGPLLRP
jgi:4-methyl-5(b-hydroxyethyl)-thiazole monophosphate biosynthesis